MAASGGVTVTKSGATGFRYGAVGIQASSDAAAVVTIEAPAGTLIWSKRFAAAFTHSETFYPGTVEAGANVNLLVKVSANTSKAEANMQGYSIIDKSA